MFIKMPKIVTGLRLFYSNLNKRPDFYNLLELKSNAKAQ